MVTSYSTAGCENAAAVERVKPRARILCLNMRTPSILVVFNIKFACAGEKVTARGIFLQARQPSEKTGVRKHSGLCQQAAGWPGTHHRCPGNPPAPAP